MIAKTTYNDLKEKRLEETVVYLDSLEKWKVCEVKLIDALNQEALNKPITGMYFNELSPCGVYLFYDEEGDIRYIGQTHESFYKRLLTQLDSHYYEGYAWNSMLTKMGVQRCGKQHADLTEEDYDIDLETVCNWKFLVIDTGSHEEVSPKEIKWLEKMLLKANRVINGEKLLNNMIGGLSEEQWEIPLDQLIRQ